MLKNKNILVTSGGTQEFIDDVRVITNTSTGATGSKIARYLIDAGAAVYYVHGATALIPDDPYRRLVPFKAVTAHDAMTIMEAVIKHKKINAVVHAMAVSDFTFKRDTPLKCKSNDPQAFVDFMSRSITLNPKIISHIKSWRPETILVGFKFEVGASLDDLYSLAKASIEKNGCDLVVANDKEEMSKQGVHVAHFIYSDDIRARGFKDEMVSGNNDIAQKIREFLDAVLL
jgi:phosphopantothenate-cysteine ligase